MSAQHPSYTMGSPADWSLIPDYMIGGLRRYIENGIEPGSFLSAVLCNDLRGAVSAADDTNRHRLFQYVQFLYLYAPSECWGSPSKVEKWCAQRGLSAKSVYDDGPVEIVEITS